MWIVCQCVFIYRYTKSLVETGGINIFIFLQTPVKPSGIFPNSLLQSHLSAIDPMKDKPHGPEVPVGECQ